MIQRATNGRIDTATMRGEPDPVTQMTLGELADFQSIAAHHITFSMTLACPLRCSHCIVSASPDLRHTTMPLAVAESYAAQLPALATHGIRSLSFTGGEPFLARRQMKVLTDAAAAAGLSSGVVTAGHWAKDRILADALVAEYPGIRNWDISIDRFHLDWMALETALTAIAAARDAGRIVTVRFSYEDPPTEEDGRIWDAVHQIDGVKVAAQRVRVEGRARDEAEGAHAEPRRRYSPWVKPCLTQGMVVRYDGSVAPCCLNLVETRQHEFQFPSAREGALSDLHDQYLSHPLLQLIRVLGFSELWRWLEEEGLTADFADDLPDDACDLCAYLMRRPVLSDYLAKRAAQPEVEARIAVLAARILGERVMARRLLAKWERDPGSRPPGFEHLGDYIAALEAGPMDAEQAGGVR